MKYLRFNVKVTEIQASLEKEHSLPEGQWGKPVLTRDGLALTFGSEEVKHPYSFAMTMDEWNAWKAGEEAKVSEAKAQVEAEKQAQYEAQQRTKKGKRVAKIAADIGDVVAAE